MRRLTGTMRLAATTLAAALAVAVLAGCAASHRVRGADKAGGSDAPLVLRLGDVDSEDYSITTRVLEYFGEQVAELSGGTLRVRVIYDAAGRERADGEAQVARKVRDGSFDLGWIGAAAWDELGVTSFQALHTLFANPASLRALTDAERAELEQAASRTLAHVGAMRRSAQAAIAQFCSGGRAASPTGGGRVVLASRAERAALVRATRPVYSELERDPDTRTLIRQIRALKRSLPPAPAIRVPKGCSVSPERGPTGSTAPRATTRLDGTYRWVLTKADAIRFGQPPDKAPVGGVSTRTLRDGKWIGDGSDGGTYKLIGDRIAFSWPSENSVLIFAFSRDRNGTLHLTPAPSMDRGDRFVWSSEPWRRIGPPVRPIP